jgi:hypothetical protein
LWFVVLPTFQSKKVTWMQTRTQPTFSGKRKKERKKERQKDRKKERH